MPPPFPFIFIHFVERNVNGELQCLWVSVKVAHCKLPPSLPQKQATFSAALIWFSSTAKGVLQIYTSGGHKPVLEFLGLFCVISFFLFVIPFDFSLGQLLIISWYSCCI